MTLARENLIVPLCLCVWACTGTEAGNPPFGPETNPISGLSPADISVSIPCPDGIGCMIGEMVVLTVDIPRDTLPPGVTDVFATALDTGEMPVRFEANEASFAGTVHTPSNGELRIQVTTDRRLAPMDLRLADELTLVPVTREFQECLLFERRDYALTSAAPSTIRLRNDCADTVTLAASATRLGSTAFDVRLLTEAELLPGHEAAFEAAATSDSGPDEDVLFIEVAGGLSGRQPITLHRMR